MAFAVESTSRGRIVVIAVSGDVDIATADDLRAHLVQGVECHDLVVVDLDGVGFMDSTGLGVLVASYNRATARGRHLVVARPQRIVKNALRLVQVDTVICIYDSLDDALAAV